MPLSASQIKSLRLSPLFSGCDMDEYAPLVESLEPCALPKGTAMQLSEFPNEGRSMCVLLSGEVEICTANGVILMLVRAPFCFSSILNLSGGLESDIIMPMLSARTSSAVLTFLPMDKLSQCMKKDSTMMMNMLQLQHESIMRMLNIVHRVTAPSPSVRLAILLLQNSVMDEFDASFGVSKLAKSLDVSRATLYRAFGELEEQNLIHRDGKLILISDREKLTAFIRERQNETN